MNLEQGSAWRGVLSGGAVYFALVMTAGSLFGMLRTTLLLPAVGPLYAVLIELPFMLVICWFVCGATIRRFRVDWRATARLLMGLFAFALLMGAEALLFVQVFDGTLAGFLAARLTPPGCRRIRRAIAVRAVSPAPAECRQSGRLIYPNCSMPPA